MGRFEVAILSFFAGFILGLLIYRITLQIVIAHH